MIVRALDQNGDWTYGQGQNNYLSGVAAIEQSIQTRLKSFLGNCFFNTSVGIDWFNLLGGKNILAVQLAVSATILNTQGVLAILSLDMNLSSDRNLVITYSVSVQIS